MYCTLYFYIVQLFALHVLYTLELSFSVSLTLFGLSAVPPEAQSRARLALVSRSSLSRSLSSRHECVPLFALSSLLAAACVSNLSASGVPRAEEGGKLPPPETPENLQRMGNNPGLSQQLE